MSIEFLWHCQKKIEFHSDVTLISIRQSIISNHQMLYLHPEMLLAKPIPAQIEFGEVTFPKTQIH